MSNSTGTETTHFGWPDYAAFGVMVALSTIVGGLIGVCGKQDTKVDYLLGGRTMKVLPIAVSLVFSQISAIAMIGVPTEVYTHGTQYYAIAFSLVIASIINNYVFLPVFFDLKFTSTYEYLELRFNQQIRFIVSLLFNISIFLYIPVVIYVPALTFNQVSGVDVHLITVIVSMTCIFYTMLGGLKAVVWTDFLQSFVTVGSSIIIIVIGIVHVGGIAVVFQRSYEGQRLELFNFDPSPVTRSTFWTVTLGMTFAWLSSMAASQGMVQKIVALPDLQSARKSIAWFCAGNIFMKSLTVLVGLTIYATYYECDPIYSKKVSKPEQVVALFVTDTAGSTPCLPGLFIAGIFSAALSTMSSDLNCISATVYEDFLLPCVNGKKNLERKAHIVLKIIVIVFGVLCVLMVYVVEHMGAIFDLSFSLSGITMGTFLGIYSLGMLFPWANVKGAMAGTLSSIALMSWMVFGAEKAVADGLLTYPYLPMSTEGCSDYNGTLTNASSVRSNSHEDEIFIMYRVSYMLYPLVGTIFVLAVGLPVSWVTGFSDPRQVDPRLIVPFMRRFVGPPASPREKEKLCQATPSQDISTESQSLAEVMTGQQPAADCSL